MPFILHIILDHVLFSEVILIELHVIEMLTINLLVLTTTWINYVHLALLAHYSALIVLEHHWLCLTGLIGTNGHYWRLNQLRYPCLLRHESLDSRAVLKLIMIDLPFYSKVALAGPRLRRCPTAAKLALLTFTLRWWPRGLLHCSVLEAQSDSRYTLLVGLVTLIFFIDFAGFLVGDFVEDVLVIEVWAV